LPKHLRPSWFSNLAMFLGFLFYAYFAVQLVIIYLS